MSNRDNKRKQESVSSKKKKQKVSEMDMTPSIDNTWVSASKTRNFMLKDPLLDWLSMYGEQKGFVSDSKNETSIQKDLNYGRFIMTKGIEFEGYIVSLMKNKHTNDFHEVSGAPIWNHPLEKIHRQIKDTYNLMKKGAKIIYQGLVYNPVNKTWGYPDLIVRSDYLNSLCETKVITDEKSKKGCRFSDDWHYRIVDIKYSTLKMKVDGKSLLNQGSILPYKAQTYVYNRALGYIQNLVPRKAYILGRGWNTTGISVYKPFDKLGQVDFISDKEICEDVKSAVEWVRNLRNLGSSWQVLPIPSILELYPNMCNDSNNDWGNAKKKIAEELHEITSVWQCGVADREMCHEKKVYKWSDPKCNSELMNKGGKVNPLFIDKILEVNRGSEKFSFDKTVKVDGWRRDDNIPSFFIDFETVSNINNVRSTDEDGNIFMIGSVIDSLSSDDPKDSDRFSSFVSSRLTYRDEKKIIEDFLKYVSDICVDVKTTKCRFYHYSSIEPSVFKKAVQKYNIVTPIYLEIEWVDILTIIKSKKVVIKGALDFSLKTITKALHSHGLINISYSESDIGDGSQAMISAFLCDDMAMKKSVPMKDLDLMKNIIKYNKVDCVVLQKIRDFLENIDS